jgi:hypothetical protein
MKAKLTPCSRKPVEIKGGNVSVRIYTGNKCIGELVATKLANGENEVLRLPSTDKAVYAQAMGHLRPLDVPLNVAVLEYVSAVKSLPEGTTLKEAADFFRRREPGSPRAR